ncbi:hypothetical protein LMG27198_41810 [Methylocystis echinoides]|uniref:Uncharacterized protein n=1 Tax=Methylocystis echinoides TaxID=29468 RepID=A0A9W6GYA0_9HYPH|nr:hypothetical protein LMG27198_41810 [Methylocystis echinoides]
MRVFSILVKRQFETWPEAHEREARWFEAEKAVAALKEQRLRELAAVFVHKKLGKRSRRKKDFNQSRNPEAIERLPSLNGVPSMNRKRRRDRG